MIGHQPVKMADVQKVFEQLGYLQVRTLGASGNVLFETAEEKQTFLMQEIEEQLEKACGYPIRVLLRTIPKIQALVDSDPFKGVTVTSSTKLLITFLSETERPKNTIPIPYTSPENDFKILHVFPHEICSVAFLSPTRQRTGLLSFLEKAFGKEITTRNWSTVTRILKGA